MTSSVNRVILIGNLGRNEEAVKPLYERYLGSLRAFHAAFGGDARTPFAVAARRLAEALRQLRNLVGQLLVPVVPAWRGAPVVNRIAAFFHVAKVDGRNLP